MSQPVRTEQNLTNSEKEAMALIVCADLVQKSPECWRQGLLRRPGSLSAIRALEPGGGRRLALRAEALRRAQRQLQTDTPLESTLGGNGAATSTHGLLRQAPGVQRTESGRESVVAARSGKDCLSHLFACGVHPGLRTDRAHRNPGKPTRILRASPFRG